MWGLRFKAILIGFATDTFSTMVVATQIGILVTMNLGFSHAGTPDSDIQFKEMMNSVPMIIFSYITGCLCTLFGGFLTGWIAQIDRIKNSAVMGMLSAMMGLLSYADHSLGYNVATAFLILACAMTGGYIAERRYGPPSVKRAGQIN